MNILEVRNLSVVLKAGKQKKTLVDDVSFQVAPGECVGVLGESGSGKSMTSKAVLGLLDRNFKVSGQAAVSYTHLDVYKRQVGGPGQQVRGV